LVKQIPDSKLACSLNVFLKFSVGLNFSKNFEKVENNLIYAKPAQVV
jgi:hypothetical protein